MGLSVHVPPLSRTDPPFSWLRSVRGSTFSLSAPPDRSLSNLASSSCSFSSILCNRFSTNLERLGYRSCFPRLPMFLWVAQVLSSDSKPRIACSFFVSSHDLTKSTVSASGGRSDTEGECR
ncbi:hypothetical protein ACHAXH_002616 [Discostella pseudostelligera]